MKVSRFDFLLPPELIAQQPLPDRDASRMLVVRQESRDAHIADFINYLEPGDVVVFNNSKVIPCRFSAGDYEITLHTNAGENLWWGFAKKFNKLKIGDKLRLNDGTKIEVLDKNDDSGLLIKFDRDNVFEVLERIGRLPLPPYIKRETEAADEKRYQTIYANPLGSMAAPTAGLHFTDAMIAEIKKRAMVVNITLHVGAGTWMPVKVEDTADHKMHAEWGVITPEQAEIINSAKRVIAIGTTSLRLLESAAVSGSSSPPPQAAIGGYSPRIRAFAGTTDIFITPGYEFKVVDVLLTNFHLPRSTLFMLTCAFAGTDEMTAAYAHAILEKYRFFSYGDCCLLFRK